MAKATQDKPKKSVYEIVTDQVIEMLEAGQVPWRKNWNTHQPQNGVSHRPYHGLNALFLGIAPYKDPRWFTFNQAKAKGGMVRKGEKGRVVIFYRMLEKEDPTTGEKDLIPVLRYFTVFNLEQLEGLDLPPIQKVDFQPLEKAQLVLDDYLQREGIRMVEGGNRAAYSPVLDRIVMPDRRDFHSPEAFYSTAFHECAHSTGHSSRLGRFKAADELLAPSEEEYSKEELIAELGAAFLNNVTGISSEMESTVAYLQGWLKVLRADSRLLVQAASQARKAADLVLGIQAEEAPVAAEEAGAEVGSAA